MFMVSACMLFSALLNGGSFKPLLTLKNLTVLTFSIYTSECAELMFHGRFMGNEPVQWTARVQVM